MLNNNTRVFCSFPIVKKHQIVTNEGIIRGKCEGGNNAVSPVYQGIENVSQTWKIPGKVPDFALTNGDEPYPATS